MPPAAVLCDLGMNIEEKCLHWGRTAVEKAVKVNAYETLHVLLEKGAKVNVDHDSGINILHLAAKVTNSRIWELLINHRVDSSQVHAVDNDGFSPMDYLRLRKDVNELPGILKKLERPFATTLDDLGDDADDEEEKGVFHDAVEIL
ncbi:uncharacterized protein BDZ99DRAFT_440120 [Mytilinidion resinicola]|uniref:Ankyrin n=1 Tax=Mytilinidion resinicola TaxID=574789 RepID=A0A6A6YTM2_9PEZI|nr:uncharacterized protein BDZ99DRAFT_440120 [Mytilinidion resinicola]KAF2811315.1 hypothetical protein BDZ99DRAFT_440120 [Mytilinidion resinicola]